MKITKLSTTIRAEIVDQIGMSLWEFILCSLHLFRLHFLNSLWLYACHSSRLNNYFRKYRKQLLAISSFSSLPSCPLLDLETLRVPVNLNYLETLSVFWVGFSFLFLNTHVDRLSLSITVRRSRQKRSTEWEEGWKLTVMQYSKTYEYSFCHSH